MTLRQVPGAVDDDGSMSARQTVELLYFDGCPSHERLLPVVAGLADQARAELRLRRIETPEEAEAERFLGSPSVRVDGVDVDPGATGREDFGLKCRLYRFEGRQSATPPEAWIRAALEGRPLVASRRPRARVTVKEYAPTRTLGRSGWAASRVTGADLP